MTFLLDVAIRSSAPVFPALLACALLRNGSAALRHRVLAVAVVAVAAVVPLSVVLPSWNVPLTRASLESFDSQIPATSQHEVDGAVSLGTPASAPVARLEIVLLVWIMGVAVETGRQLRLQRP